MNNTNFVIIQYKQMLQPRIYFTATASSDFDFGRAHVQDGESEKGESSENFHLTIRV